MLNVASETPEAKSSSVLMHKEHSWKEEQETVEFNSTYYPDVHGSFKPRQSTYHHH